MVPTLFSPVCCLQAHPAFIGIRLAEEQVAIPPASGWVTSNRSQVISVTSRVLSFFPSDLAYTVQVKSPPYLHRFVLNGLFPLHIPDAVKINKEGYIIVWKSMRASQMKAVKIVCFKSQMKTFIDYFNFNNQKSKEGIWQRL